MTSSSRPNRLIGVWLLDDSYIVQADGTKIPEFWGPKPIGQLIFTPELYFNAVVHRSDRPLLPSDHDIKSGTPELHSEIFKAGFSNIGRYFIDADGWYDGHEILGCSMPNWVGQKKSKEELVVIPSEDGETALERINMGPVGELHLQWKRAR